MKKTNKHDILVQATQKLKRRGYIYDFEVMTKGGMEETADDWGFSPDEEGKLRESHSHKEDMTKPDDTQ